MPERREEQPKVINLTSTVRLEDVLRRTSEAVKTPGLTNDPNAINRARLGEGNRPNELMGGRNTFGGSSMLELRSTDPNTLNRKRIESTAVPNSSAAPTKTPQPFKLPGGYDPSKKKNAGGLPAARQHVVPDFFPGQLDQLKLGPMRVQPIAFNGASPQTNLRTVAFQGFLRNQA